MDSKQNSEPSVIQRILRTEVLSKEQVDALNQNPIVQAVADFARGALSSATLGLYDVTNAANMAGQGNGKYHELLEKELALTADAKATTAGTIGNYVGYTGLAIGAAEGAVAFVKSGAPILGEKLASFGKEIATQMNRAKVDSILLTSATTGPGNAAILENAAEALLHELGIGAAAALTAVTASFFSPTNPSASPEPVAGNGGSDRRRADTALRREPATITQNDVAPMADAAPSVNYGPPHGPPP